MELELFSFWSLAALINQTVQRAEISMFVTNKASSRVLYTSQCTLAFAKNRLWTKAQGKHKKMTKKMIKYTQKYTQKYTKKYTQPTNELESIMQRSMNKKKGNESESWNWITNHLINSTEKFQKGLETPYFFGFILKFSGLGAPF